MAGPAGGAQLLRLRNSMLSTSLTDAQQELTQAALHDPLTRLPNRLLLQRRASCRRWPKPNRAATALR